MKSSNSDHLLCTKIHEPSSKCVIKMLKRHKRIMKMNLRSDMSVGLREYGTNIHLSPSLLEASALGLKSKGCWERGVYEFLDLVHMYTKIIRI